MLVMNGIEERNKMYIVIMSIQYMLIILELN